jgi:hypothetical protein
LDASPHARAKARVFYDKSVLNYPGPRSTVSSPTWTRRCTSGTAEAIKGPNVKMSDRFDVLQPAFDPSGYEATAKMLVEQILQMSGFALQTFGIDRSSSKSADTTATEIESRERRTFLTRGRQIRTASPHLSRIISKLLAVDAAVFNTPNVVAPIWVEFPDSVQESMLRLAQTAQTLFAGQSASLEERIKLLHPDWNDDMWDDEVAKVQQEFAAPVTDPFDLPPESPKPGQADPGISG